MAYGINGAVIGGGRSSRFGSPKALLSLDGVPLACRLLEAMGAAGVVRRAYNAAREPCPLPTGVDLVPDGVAGRGPLEGLACALAWSRGPVLVAPCDLPGLADGAAFRSLLAHWAPGLRGLVARGVDGWHPLLGIYDPELLPEIERRLALGKNGLRALADDLGLEAWRPREHWVVNINTPAEWADWCARSGMGPGGGGIPPI